MHYRTNRGKGYFATVFLNSYLCITLLVNAFTKAIEELLDDLLEVVIDCLYNTLNLRILVCIFYTVYAVYK